MKQRVSELVIQEFVLIVNQKRLLKTVLQRTENNNIIVKVATQEVSIIIPTKLIVKS